MKIKNYFLSIGFTIIIMFFSVIHYSFPGFFSIMNDFPTHPEIRLTSIKWVETIFDYAVIKGDAVFTAITIGIRSVLDFLELLFVKTPWIVIITTIVVLTALSAGIRTAVLIPADKAVKTTMVVIITIQGVLTNKSSKKSRTDLIPIVIAVNTASPFITA